MSASVLVESGSETTATLRGLRCVRLSVLTDADEGRFRVGGYRTE
ncbi:hypothetical protein AB0G97_26835 [Streptomyces sp. NPDC020755]